MTLGSVEVCVEQGGGKAGEKEAVGEEVILVLQVEVGAERVGGEEEAETGGVDYFGLGGYDRPEGEEGEEGAMGVEVGF